MFKTINLGSHNNDNFKSEISKVLLTLDTKNYKHELCFYSYELCYSGHKLRKETKTDQWILLSLVYNDKIIVNDLVSELLNNWNDKEESIERSYRRDNSLGEYSDPNGSYNYNVYEIGYEDSLDYDIYLEIKSMSINKLPPQNIPTIKYYDNAELDKDLIIKENWKPGVFMWTNKQTGDKYVGCSIKMSKYLSRFYRIRSRGVDEECSKIWKDVFLYGHSQFSVSILMYLSRRRYETNEDLHKRTIIEKYNFIKLIKPEYNRS